MTEKKPFQCPECDVAGTYLHNLVTHWYGAHYRHGSEQEQEALENRLIETVNGLPKEVKEKHGYDLGEKARKQIKERDKSVAKDLDGEVPISEFEVADAEPAMDSSEAGEDARYNLKRFLDPEHLGCREERHFAFVLAAQLAAKGADGAVGAEILRKLAGSKSAQAESIEILDVIYEVTIMRDLWCPTKEQREEVQSRLYAFLKSKRDALSSSDNDSANGLSALIEEALEPKDKDESPFSSSAPKLVRWMMKAKPDIGVVWRERGANEKVYLSFLECKFLSAIGRYGASTEQTAIQKLILEFLCSDPDPNKGHGLGITWPDHHGAPVRVIGAGVHLVQFTHDNFPTAKLSGADKNKSHCEIRIEDLLNGKAPVM